MLGQNFSRDSHQRIEHLARIGSIAALYAAATWVTMIFFSGLAWGPVQFRVSEALCVLALFTVDAIPGLGLGCVIANLINIVLSGTGALGILDVVGGSLATLAGAWITWRLRDRPALAIMGPVVANAVIVPAYLPILLQGIGFYTVPFTDWSLDGLYLAMYGFGFVSIGLGEAVVLYVLGFPLAQRLRKTSAVAWLLELNAENAVAEASVSAR